MEAENFPKKEASNICSRIGVVAWAEMDLFRELVDFFAIFLPARNFGLRGVAWRWQFRPI